MQRLVMVVMTLVAMLGVGGVAAAEGALKGGLAVLEPWLGTWQIEAEWSSGETLWAQSEYRPLLGGAFLEGRVFVREGGGELYQRYRTVLAWRDGGVEVHAFNHDGSLATSAMAVDGPVTTSSWTMGDTAIDERLELAADGATMRWQVWMTPAEGARQQIMDGVWRRVEAEPIGFPVPDALAPSMEALTPLLGGWETAASWSDGEPLWSRVEYRPGLGGRFVDASTWVATAEGGWQQRYEAVLVASGDRARFEMVELGPDGRSRLTPVDVREGSTGVVLGRSGDSAGEETLRWQVELESPTVYRWQVWTRSTPGAEWTERIDARWQRQGAPPGVREAVDPGRFVADGDTLRSFVKEAVIAAAQPVVWAAWADAEAWGRLFGPPSRGRFDLAIGGAYEWLFDGVIGGNGDQVLAYLPGRMLAFSWNAPPSQPVTRLARTWVVVELEPVDGKTTRVRLTHLGFGEGPEWDETFAYFDSAWERVLALMAARLAPEETSSAGS